MMMVIQEMQIKIVSNISFPSLDQQTFKKTPYHQIRGKWLSSLILL